ncbi:hypothetical protein GCM10027591_01290 [Zhihengliuella somnathii]
MAEKRRGLGRGLGALISSSPAEESTETPQEQAGQQVTPRGSTAPGGASKAPQKPSSGAQSTSTAEKPSKASGTAQKGAEGPSQTGKAKAGQGSGSGVAANRAAAKSANARPAAAKPAPAQPAAERPQSGVAKARPVDMFFTPGRTAGEEQDDAGRNENSSTRTKSARSAKRPQMPDVIGQARSRSAASPADSSETSPKQTQEDGAEQGDLLPVPGATFAEIPVEDIHPNRKQPREVFDEDEMAELVHSVKEIGLLQPIVVRPSSEKDDAAYELVMGERRWRATQAAGLATIPAIVRQTTDEDLLRDALLENLHRSQLNPLEEAAAYQQLLEEFGCTQDELSTRIGRSRPQISNTIRLMKLPPLVQRRVAAGVLSQGHARALLALTDPAEIERLAQRIVAEGLSVRATEEAVAMNEGVEKKRRESKPKNTARHERLDYLANSLSDRLDTNVKISLGAKKGKVAIEFASVDDLNRIMSLIAPEESK